MITNQIVSEEDLEMWALCRAMGDVFQRATTRYELVPFAEAYLKSGLFEQFFADLTLFSQSPGYVLNKAEGDKRFHIPERTPALYDEEVGYWMGYLLSAWQQSGKADVTKFGTEELTWLYNGYDVLHTIDVFHVYRKYMEEKVRAESLQKRNSS